MDKTSELIRAMVDAGCVGIEFMGGTPLAESARPRYSASCFYNNHHIETGLLDTPFEALSELLNECVSKAKNGIRQTFADMVVMKQAAHDTGIKLIEELE